MPLPANVTTGLVTGRFLIGVTDGVDADTEPEVVAARGSVTFTPSVAYLPSNDLAEPFTMVTRPLRGVIDDEGYLCSPDPADPTQPSEVRGVRLFATDNPAFPTKNWSWAVQYSLTDKAGVFLGAVIPSHALNVAPGAEIDLTLMIQVPAAPPTSVSQAEALVIAATREVDRIAGMLEGVEGGTVQVDDIEDSSEVGRNVLKAIDAPAARTAIGAGTSNLQIGETQGTAKVGNYTPAWSEVRNRPDTYPSAPHAHTAQDISDFTEAAQDAIAALLAAGTGVTLAYDDLNNSLQITSSTAGQTLDAEAVRDAIGVALIGLGPINVTVNDEGDTITISSNATANFSDDYLLEREHHTGEQPISTVSGLGTALSALEDSADRVHAAADPVAHLSQLAPFAQFDARPAGTLLWPQSFSVNDAEAELYVAMSGPLVEGASNTLRISVRNLDGTIKTQRDIPTAAATSSEGLPWFRNAEGQLCFIVRPADAGVGYAIYNYDLDTLGTTIPITGNFKSAVAGNVFATCDAHTASGGVGNVYMYDWASVKAGAPTLLSTVKLETRNLMNKVQSFTINGGAIIFNHGASKTEPYLSAYTLTGKLITAFQLDKPGFADALNAAFPGTILDRASYRHESEGADVYRGQLLTGHVTDNNASVYKFTILRHNAVDGVYVAQLPQVMNADTGWVDLPLSTTPNLITTYAVGQTPQYRRIGDACYFRGAVKGLPTSPVSVLVGTLPFGLSAATNATQMTSSGKTANWQVNTAGTIYVLNSGNAGDTNSWFPLPTGPFFTN